MTQSHTGLYVVGVLVAVVWGALTYSAVRDREGRPVWGWATLICALGLYFVYYCSFHDTAPKNEKVIATYEGPFAEVSTRDVNTKPARTEVTHVLYGKFRVPEGLVALPISPGVAIAPRVILYKN